MGKFLMSLTLSFILASVGVTTTTEYVEADKYIGTPPVREWYILTYPVQTLPTVQDQHGIITIHTRDDIDYITYAEFELMCCFVETVAGNEGFDTQYDVASAIINRLNSDMYPNYIDEIIWKKGDNGLWKYIPNDVDLESVIPSDSVYEAVTEALFVPSENKGTDIEIFINNN